MLPLTSFSNYLNLLSRAPTRINPDIGERRRKSDLPLDE
jgi:hypothetical protein